MKYSRRLLPILVLLSFTIQPASLLAQATSTGLVTPSPDQGFNAEMVLDDRDVFELGGMNRDRIQEFLASHGTLGSTKVPDTDGVNKPIADIIWRVATSYKINPKYLMALLQKEQSLVEDPSPTPRQFDWATGYGVCDNCSKNDPAIQDFKGFASQIEWAAKQHREKYLQQILSRGKTIAGYAPGKEATIDGRRIIPQNQATAMLYSYTPHIAGNLNLWRIWRRWFGLNFPDGTIVQGRTSKQVYLISFGQKRPFKSLAVAASMVDRDKIALVDDSQMTNYPQGKPIAFANYSLVETDGKRYLIDGPTKRFIINKKVFKRLGFNEDEIIDADKSDLEPYTDGPDITIATAYPTGLLAKDSKGTYWYVDGETRHLIGSKSLVNLYFRSQPAKTLTTKQLQALTIGDPYTLHDGELIRSNKKTDVYVIEHGVRRPIPTRDVFEEMGWNWKNIVTLPESLVAQYAVGDPIDPYKNNTLLTQTAVASLDATP
jgi:hypothetical protein